MLSFGASGPMLVRALASRGTGPETPIVVERPACHGCARDQPRKSLHSVTFLAQSEQRVNPLEVCTRLR